MVRNILSRTKLLLCLYISFLIYVNIMALNARTSISIEKWLFIERNFYMYGYVIYILIVYYRVKIIKDVKDLIIIRKGSDWLFNKTVLISLVSLLILLFVNYAPLLLINYEYINDVSLLKIYLLITMATVLLNEIFSVISINYNIGEYLSLLGIPISLFVKFAILEGIIYI